MKGWLNMVSIILALGMMLYAVPQLQVGHGFTLPTIFAIVWLSLALTVIAAHLHGVLQVDKEVKLEQKQMERMRSL
jgi:type II secretory pathway component PulJ